MMLRRFLPDTRLERLVHPVHVGRVLDPAAAGRMEHAEDVGSEIVPAQAARFLPALLGHEIAALDHLIRVADLECDVVDGYAVRAVAQQEVMMLDVTFALHERAHGLDDVDGAEFQPLRVEGIGLLMAFDVDVEGDVDDPQGPGAAVRSHADVAPANAGGKVVPACRDFHGSGFREAEADGEATLIARMQGSIRSPQDLTVLRQLRTDRLESRRLGHAPDDFADVGTWRGGSG